MGPPEKLKGIYIATDLDAEESAPAVYIGATNDAISRFGNHRHDLRNGRHHNSGLQEVVNNGHRLKLTFIPVTEDVDPFELEKRLIDEFKPTGILFNQARGMGERSHSKSSIEKMRSAKLGKKLSQEHRQKISQGVAGKLVGIKKSPEHIAKMRQQRLKQSKPVTIDGVDFTSIGAAARALNIDASTVNYRIANKNPRYDGWFFSDSSKG